ncbi:MAG: RagB/SusD family nutrient uptake outer membrane protein [Chitinophaga sp.]|uniref:RagB/SusD family nutrient uptake outer membrane protein n=1 Tax=Chitinophaga sp. TaxID=1869181 RepID=UPI0025B82AE6|nr:RagB/SusD family nutrient uptake outer membrane protein [Chitinophaga sp.]MBV8252057.1 RagB/SusD family nutrient uptake outer membrane protein [Chitinophaga sp.]
MKLIIKIVAVISVLVIIRFATSCKKNFLSVTDPNRITETQFWKTENDVMAAVAAVYSPLRVPLYSYWGAFTGFQDMNAMGDDVYTIPGEEPATWQVATFSYDSKNGDLQSIFDKCYKSIYRANEVLENIDKVPIDPAKKKSYIAEVKFLRGLSYFVLASNWGAVPLKLKVAQSASDNYPATAAEADVWKQVISDFSDAKDGLPATRVSPDLGRATSGAAIAFLGKAYLYTKDYTHAETTLDALFQAPYQYGLVNNFEDNFTDKNKFNNEAVFQWVFGPFGDPYNPWGDENSKSGKYNYIPQLIGPPAGGGWFKYVPSNFLVNEFFKELRPAGSDTKFDKRMYASLTWKYSTQGETDTTWYDGKSFDDLWSSGRNKITRFYPTYPVDTITRGKFLIKKFTSAYRNVGNADNYWGATPSTANYVIMRFAEVILNRAEAACQNGNLPKAISDINAIRRRAGLPDKTAADLTDKVGIMAELSHQKLLEMFMEQNRWNDLKRWKTPADLKAWLISVNKQEGSRLEAKHYQFPLPAAELQANPNAKQNPLWQ